MNTRQFISYGLILGLGLSGAGCSSGEGAGSVAESVDQMSTTTFDFVEKEQAFQNFDPSAASGDELFTQLNEYLAASQQFKDGYEQYVQNRENYLSDAGIESSSRPLIRAQGTADPQLAIQIGQLIEQGNARGKTCKELLDAGKEDEANDCMNQAKKELTAAAFRTGVSATVGGGAAVVTGLAIAAAPISIGVVAATGVTIGVGVVVGLVWDWCTAPSSNRLRAASGELQTCNFSSREAALAGSSTNAIASTSLPQGTGKVTINIPGCAPIVKTITVGETGAHISVKCIAAGAEGAEVKDAIDETSTTDAPETPEGATCGNISGVFANPSPTDPAPGQGVTVTATIFPALSGCGVSYSVSGTDGYSDSGSPTTDTNSALGAQTEKCTPCFPSISITWDPSLSNRWKWLPCFRR